MMAVISKSRNNIKSFKLKTYGKYAFPTFATFNKERIIRIYVSLNIGNNNKSLG